MTDIDRIDLHHARLDRIIDRLRQMSSDEHALLLAAIPHDTGAPDVSAYDHHMAVVDAINAAIGVVIDLGYTDPGDGGAA
jgi:hypothetical protein